MTGWNLGNTSVNVAVDPVPYLNDSGQEEYLKYLNKSRDRAFAISPSGAWGWKSADLFQSFESVKNQAIFKCQRHSPNPCYFYAINKEVVWDSPAPDDLRKLEMDLLEVSIELPERWKSSCNDTVSVTKTMHAYLCNFTDSKKKASAIWAVRQEEGDISAWGEEMGKYFMKKYASDGKNRFPYSRKSTTSVAVILSNNSSGSAVHETYLINGHNRNVSQLMFTHNGLFFWLAVYNQGNTFKLEGAEFNQIVSNIMLK